MRRSAKIINRFLETMNSQASILAEDDAIRDPFFDGMRELFGNDEELCQEDLDFYKLHNTPDPDMEEWLQDAKEWHREACAEQLMIDNLISKNPNICEGEIMYHLDVFRRRRCRSCGYDDEYDD